MFRGLKHVLQLAGPSLSGLKRRLFLKIAWGQGSCSAAEGMLACGRQDHQEDKPNPKPKISISQAGMIVMSLYMTIFHFIRCAWIPFT